MNIITNDDAIITKLLFPVIQPTSKILRTSKKTMKKMMKIPMKRTKQDLEEKEKLQVSTLYQASYGQTRKHKN
jgi:hypothetical protein